MHQKNSWVSLATLSFLVAACSGSTDADLSSNGGVAPIVAAPIPGAGGLVGAEVPGSGVIAPAQAAPVPGVGAPVGVPAPVPVGSDPVAPPVVAECDVGATTLRRLNRIELRNTLGSLFGVPVNIGTLLPDPGSAGFDNVAGALTVSPSLLGSYGRVYEGVVDAAWADPVARAKVITCDPSGAELACADSILTEWLPRIWRQPVAQEEVTRLVTAIEPLFADESFDDAMKVAFKSALLSHKFIYHVKEASPGGQPTALNAYEVANRLSYFLWSDMPDAALLEKAAAGTLTDPSVVTAEVGRMMDDEKSNALLEGFVSQWLRIRGFDELQKDPDEFPGFTADLRQAMLQETTDFMEAALHENWPLRELLIPKELFANETLLDHYGTPQLATANSRSPVGTSGRGGLLTQGSILSVTSPGTEEGLAVVERGLFVLERLLCSAPPPPPPNVATLEDSPIDITQPLKQVLAEHNESAACAACHALMDPIGYALEGFDWVGRSRDVDAHGNAIDATGKFPDGRSFDGPAELAEALTQGDQFASCISEHLLTYSLGRIPAEVGHCAAREVTANWEPQLGMRDLIERIAVNRAFLSRGTEQQ